MKKEEWKRVPDFGDYFVSNFGRIYNSKTGRYLCQKNPKNYRYKKVRLSNESVVILKDLHRIIAETFIPNPNNLRVVNHKNGNTFDNNVENLEWVSYSSNNKHAYESSLKLPSHLVLTEDNVKFIRENTRNNGGKYNSRQLAEMFGVSKGAILQCVWGMTHKRICSNNK